MHRGGGGRGEYLEYIRKCSVHQGNTEDIMLGKSVTCKVQLTCKMVEISFHVIITSHEQLCDLI